LIKPLSVPIQIIAALSGDVLIRAAAVI